MQIPEELLAKLQEFTTGGFALFTVTDHGVDSYLYTDNEVIQKGLSSHIVKVLSIQDNIDSQLIQNSLMADLMEEEKDLILFKYKIIKNVMFFKKNI